MAIGIARWCGFNIPPNFDSPYQSKSITEFWRRWHISLSSWLKDYLYISLGGNRKGRLRQYVNLLITMLLGGFWHGASWNYIIWGGMQGTALGLDKVKEYLAKKLDFFTDSFFMKLLGIIFTFHFVCLCWIFFRTDTIDDAFLLLRQIAKNFNAGVLSEIFYNYRNVLGIMLLGFILHAIPKSFECRVKKTISHLPLFVIVLIAITFTFIFLQIKSTEPVMPVYLQF